MGAARYKPYPAYKSSNVDWLGNIPESWKVIQVGRLFRRVKRTGHTEKQLLSVYRDHGVIPKASRDDNNNKASEDLSPYQLVEENDLVLNKMKTWQGSIAISEHEGIVSPAYFVYQPDPKLFDVAIPKYVHFLLRNPMYISQYLRRSKGIRVSQWDLDPGEFQKIELLLPSLPEQTKIAAFLDYETGKIDALIAKQERLIALLEEKRQAVISHAVTKGLNADAPLRPSGIDWLGDVPEHWGIGRLRWYISIASGEGLSNQFITSNPNETNAIRVIGGNGAMGFTNRINTTEKRIVIGRVGALCGNVHFFDENCWITDNALQISTWRSFSDTFLVHLIRAANLNDLANKSAQPLITGNQVKSIEVAIPPMDEQEKIANFLASQIDVFAELSTKAQSAITLLKERRTALISAAVTGKIDVRDWQPPQPVSDTDLSTKKLQEAAL